MRYDISRNSQSSPLPCHRLRLLEVHGGRLCPVLIVSVRALRRPGLPVHRVGLDQQLWPRWLVREGARFSMFILHVLTPQGTSYFRPPLLSSACGAPLVHFSLINTTLDIIISSTATTFRLIWMLHAVLTALWTPPSSAVMHVYVQHLGQTRSLVASTSH